MKKNNGIGQMIVQGIAWDSDEEEAEEEEEQEEDTKKYTTEQMNNLRFIVNTKERADTLEEMDKLS